MATKQLYTAVDGHKFCYRCQQSRPVAEFYFYKRAVACPYSATCKPCQRSDRMRRYHASDKQTIWEKAFARRIMRDYGITVREYLEFLLKQGSVCAICKKPPKERCRLSVDHCHRTGKVRGLLCRACNRGIGIFKDQPALLASAMAYLEAHSTTDKNSIS